MYHNYINEINSLLAIRLRGFHLQQAQSIALSSLKELGGGPRRVEQRLRSTLNWCRSKQNDDLTLCSTVEQVSKAHERSHRALRQSAYSHHMRHARTVQAVCSELQTADQHTLVNRALRLAERARDFAKDNTSTCLNRRGFDVDLIRSETRKRKRKHAALCEEIRSLDALRSAGWLIRVYTITLTPGFHPSNQRYFGLANSPTADESAKVLRAIFADAMPNRNSTLTTSGVRRIERHKSNVPHLNAIVAFRSQDDAERFDDRLQHAYIRHTTPGRSLKVAGAFCIDCLPNGLSERQIRTDTITNSEHLYRCISYQLKNLSDSTPELVSGRVYERLGALRATKRDDDAADADIDIDAAADALDVDADANAEDKRIKTYRERRHPFLSPNIVFASISKLISKCYLRPPIRAPPST